MRLPNIDVSFPEEAVEINDAKYVPAEVLFPEWPESRTLLSKFCKETSPLNVSCIGDTVSIRPIYPIMTMCTTFPEEVIPAVNEILDGLGSYFTPKSLEKCVYEKADAALVDKIAYEIKNYEQRIVGAGGRDFKEEMEFRLGVWTLGLPTEENSIKEMLSNLNYSDGEYHEYDFF